MSEEDRLQPLPPEWRDNPFAQQVAAEIGKLQSFLHALGGIRSYLEIGSMFGWSACVVSEVMEPGGKIRLIDFGFIHEPNNESGADGYDIKPRLEFKLNYLRQRGFDVEVFYGDSHSLEAIQWARANGPYQLVGIDGDHSEGGVAADVANYEHLGEYVWLHDIANPELGVMKVWDRLKRKYAGRTVEYVCPMGIGIVNRMQVIKQTND